jgi:cytochrome c oxidase subunit 3
MSTAYSTRHPAALARTTLVVVLATESAFFGTLLMAYLYLRTSAETIPFAGQGAAHLFVPAVNTAMLLASLLAAWWALRGSPDATAGRLALALLLGAVFIAGQIFEFSRSGMRPDDGLFGGSFFALIGFHALHVIAGMVILAINAARAHLGDFRRGDRTAVEAAIWFWSFVAAVWCVLFVVLYLV